MYVVFVVDVGLFGVVESCVQVVQELVVDLGDVDFDMGCDVMGVVQVGCLDCC